MEKLTELSDHLVQRLIERIMRKRNCWSKQSVELSVSRREQMTYGTGRGGRSIGTGDGDGDGDPSSLITTGDVDESAST